VRKLPWRFKPLRCGRQSTHLRRRFGKPLTTTTTFKQFFFGSDVSTDWRVGSPISFRGNWKGKPYEDKGTIQTADSGRQLAFTHWSPALRNGRSPENYHIVDLRASTSCRWNRSRLTQANQNEAEPLTEENRKEYAKNWTMVLEGLKKVVESVKY